MLEVQLKVAVRVKVGGADPFVSKEEVASAIKRVMEGDEAQGMRKRACELGERSVRALSNNGCSTHALAQIANQWKCFAQGK
jgi:hydroquinone glucosyltransferase